MLPSTPRIAFSRTIWLVPLFFFTACQERVYTPSKLLDGGSVGDDGGGTVDDSGMGGGVDFGFVVPDSSNGPDVSMGMTGDAPPLVTGPVCGDGKIDAPEVCDDGNTMPGDGCSGVCTVEPNFMCPGAGMPCVSLVVCGDGKITGAENCDDGNTADGDGCSAKCEVEVGWTCAMAGQMCTRTVNPRCGDGSIDVGESCDDGNNTSGDGCNGNCVKEPGYVCAMPGKPCVKDAYCGDGNLDPGEACDDGNMTPADGCDGRCQIEPFYMCPTPGQPCKSTIVCGDGKVTGDEACDDNNAVGGDGCAADCKRVEPMYTCPNNNGVGGSCTKTLVPVCGDGMLSFGELCDDGNTMDGDGCSADCKTVAAGYTCTPGMKCVKVAVCGDGMLQLATGEQCDDHNTNNNDGCSANCIIEPNFICPVPGQPCVSTIVCGDGRLGGQEACDDGNTNPGDGCSHNCTVEAGWVCPAGARCSAAKCGDSIKAGAEACDDGNTVANDGCTECKIDPQLPGNDFGWVCTENAAGKSTCMHTSCGDGLVQGSEQCDDRKNTSLTDGCTPQCHAAPSCPAGTMASPGGPCTTACGDGILLATDMAAGQACDDGNRAPGDGCSPSCQQEPGWHCASTQVTVDLSHVSTIFRDFRPYTDALNMHAHPDFERFGSHLNPGIVQPVLAMDGEPMHVQNPDKSWIQQTVTSNGHPPTTPNDFVTAYGKDFDFFGVWYRDDNRFNVAIPNFINMSPVTINGQPAFQFDSAPAGGFFPIDGMGFGNQNPNLAHNWSFTTEARAWFQYQGGEKLDFTGDDDVWVFINKQLAVDLGGMHTARRGTITLANDGTGTVCDFQSIGTMATDCPADPIPANLLRPVNLHLVVGNVYEIVVFQAERHSTASNYKLTITKFNASKSVCTTQCGDGTPTPDEQCDEGALNGSGYGHCTSQCKLGPRCGDGTVNGPEQCDDGLNQSAGYSGSKPACVAGCKWSAYCGDGTVNGPEQCDLGSANNTGVYGGCKADCTKAARCGDGVVNNAAEDCDDGTNNGTPNSKCTISCKLKCGNGVPDPGEQCDDGTANNTGGYGKCTSMCTLGPRCGDGVKQSNEGCDDGKNDGTYGTCAPGCVLAPRCGDSIVQTAQGEVCDNGPNNMAMPYGKGLCDTRCHPAPYCGDKQVNPPQEKCDDGMNTGQPGSCKTDCSDYVPLPSCGDGIMQAGEQCDQGAANGTSGATCDIHCHFKCGNGTRDPGEQCDNGVNDGSYGTCKPDCTLANYCGDGVMGGPEQCDQGASNAANPYGPGKCTTNCTVAPYCGDGRIQSDFGEKCDGTPGCNNMCQLIIIM